MSAFTARLLAEFQFEAAHRMPNVDPSHPNARLHGHSYSGEVVVEGPVGLESGYVMDHGQLEESVNSVVNDLEHRYLNDVPGLELPTSEHIARWIWLRLRPKLPGMQEVTIRRKSVGIAVTYRG